MENEIMYLPVASLIEITGVLTLLTNESIIGPVDIGFSVPYVLSADVQGFGLFFVGTALTLYAMSEMK